MKAPSLQKTAVLSAFLHLTLFLVAAVVLRQSNHMKLPSPYVVDLVSQSRSAGSRHSARHVAERSRHVKRPIPAKRHVEKPKKRAQVKEKMRAPVNEKTDERRVADRIAELAALERIKERSRLREIISIPVKGQESDAKQTSQARGVGKGTGQMSEGTYMDKITGEIWKQWGWDPTMGEKNLEAVISVLIGRDGTITVKKIEKSSGNRIFDRSALMALRSASPVSPPPNRMEMEIGIRFFL